MGSHFAASSFNADTWRLPKEHRTYVGRVLQKFAGNLLMRRLLGFGDNRKVRSTIFPVAWPIQVSRCLRWPQLSGAPHTE